MADALALAMTGAAPDDEDDDAASVPPNMWLAAPETREDGSATFAEIERMRHTTGIASERLSATPAADEFYQDGPPADGDGPLLDSQARAIFASLKKLGVDGRDRVARLGYLTEVAGRPLDSMNDLRYGEARRVLTELGRRERAKDHAR